LLAFGVQFTVKDNNSLSMRINKYLAKCGVCSRREADRLIEGGEVEINGRVANLGDQIELFDQVKVKGCKIERLEKKVYVILNKPEGYICSSKGKKTVYDLVDCDERVFYVGRLDVASSGLLLLTNDGEMGERLMRPGNEHEREYEVKVKSEKREVKSEKSFDQFLEKLSQGVEIKVQGWRFVWDTTCSGRANGGEVVSNCVDGGEE
jgi:23S rRNA pseudouridine2604 synthase